VTARDVALLEYYGARAAEYEKVYAKPERQDDLRALQQLVPSLLRGRRVLDIACGTGYWTRYIAREARSITGCDLSPEVLALARVRQPADHPAEFVTGDAFALHLVPGEFDAVFVGFWWSHVRREDLARFLRGVHGRLPAASCVVIVDNRYVEGSNSAVTRTDGAGNTYQLRRLDDGTEHEVLKNFPSPDDVGTAIDAVGGVEPQVHELGYYWYATYGT
jgi:demethylmenaquinone methyltransferase/2-methoxy-6-polyprenyl-1,4-benzoquinol methylase